MQNIQLFKFFDQLTKSALFQNFALYWELKPEAKVVKKFWKPTWNLAWSQRSNMSQWDKAWHTMAMSVPRIFFMEKVLFCNLVTNSYLNASFLVLMLYFSKFICIYIYFNSLFPFIILWDEIVFCNVKVQSFASNWWRTRLPGILMHSPLFWLFVIALHCNNYNFFLC